MTSAEVVALAADAPALPTPFVFRPASPVADPRSAEELLEEIAEEIERQVAAEPRPELPPEPLLPAEPKIRPNNFSGLSALHGTAGDRPAPFRSVDQVGNSDVVSKHPDLVGLVESQPEDFRSAARAIHLRRQLEAAAEHGADLLAALGLPRLVRPDHIVVDPVAAADALDAAIAALDALDAPGEDLEPYLAGDYNGRLPLDVESEAELDEDDGLSEPILGAPERHPYSVPMTDPYYEPAAGRFARWRNHESQVSWAQGRGSEDGESEAGYDLACDEDELDEDGLSRGEGADSDREWTALKSHGRGFFASGPDDTEGDGERMIVLRRPRAWEPSAGYIATRAKQQKRGVNFPADGLARPWLLGGRMFGVRVEGDCCASEILDGSVIHINQDASPVAGDFVALWFDAERAGQRVMVAWVKRLTFDLWPGMRFPFVPGGHSSVAPMVDIESLNPPRCYGIPATRVHAVFKVVRIIPPAESIAAQAGARELRR